MNPANRAIKNRYRISVVEKELAAACAELIRVKVEYGERYGMDTEKVRKLNKKLISLKKNKF